MSTLSTAFLHISCVLHLLVINLNYTGAFLMAWANVSYSTTGTSSFFIHFLNLQQVLIYGQVN